MGSGGLIGRGITSTCSIWGSLASLASLQWRLLLNSIRLFLRRCVVPTPQHLYRHLMMIQLSHAPQLNAVIINLPPHLHMAALFRGNLHLSLLPLLISGCLATVRTHHITALPNDDYCSVAVDSFNLTRIQLRGIVSILEFGVSNPTDICHWHRLKSLISSDRLQQFDNITAIAIKTGTDKAIDWTNRPVNREMIS